MLRALIALAVLVFAALVVFFVGYAKLYQIPSAAMEPTLRCAPDRASCR